MPAPTLIEWLANYWMLYYEVVKDALGVEKEHFDSIDKNKEDIQIHVKFFLTRLTKSQVGFMPNKFTKWAMFSLKRLIGNFSRKEEVQRVRWQSESIWLITTFDWWWRKEFILNITNVIKGMYEVTCMRIIVRDISVPCNSGFIGLHLGSTLSSYLLPQLSINYPLSSRWDLMVHAICWLFCVIWWN